jgi:hypothetical protein
MLLIVALGVVGLVIILHHAAPTPPASDQTSGTPNGVDIDKGAPAKLSLTLKPPLGMYGATGSPSPFKGLGSPSGNPQYNLIQFLQPTPAGARSTNALLHSPIVHGTGLLDPLPDKGTRSKQLLTKDVLIGPGKKI